jgi:hypothetical protein
LHIVVNLSLYAKFSSFLAKYDQSQSAFFYGTEEVINRLNYDTSRGKKFKITLIIRRSARSSSVNDIFLLEFFFRPISLLSLTHLYLLKMRYQFFFNSVILSRKKDQNKKITTNNKCEKNAKNKVKIFIYL